MTMRDYIMNLLYGAGGSVLLIAITHYLYYRRFNRKWLQNKTVMITGASSGLGEACAKAFHAAGSRVILCGRRTNELERVKQILLSSEKTPQENEPIVATMDMSKSDEIKTVLGDIIKSCTRIDVLINNAGIAMTGSVLETDIVVYRKIFEVNFFGLVILTKAVIQHMIDNGGGTMLAVSSIQGRVALPHRAAYGATKHALQCFCDSLRSEVSHRNIHISVLSPGYIHTQISVNALTRDGTPSGEMSENVKNGMTAEYAANKIMDAVAYKYNEMVIGPLIARAAVYMRSLCPAILFKAMNNRAKERQGDF